MSIATYDELKTALANWLHRDNLTALIPDFIALGEARLNDELALTRMEAFADLTASTSDRFIALPPRFLKPLSLSITAANVRDDLIPIPASRLAQIVNLSSTAQPRYYAIGSQIQFECVPDQAYAMTLQYIKALDIAADASNFLLSSHPDCYLYAALEAACVFTSNDAGAQKYQDLTARAMARAVTKDGQTRSIARMSVDSSLIAAGKSHILTDA